MFELKSLKEKCISALEEAHGEKLEISANLNSSSQFALISQKYAYEYLNSKYIPGKVDMYLRLTLSYRARFRDDLVEIGKTPDYQPYGGGAPSIVSDDGKN